MNNSSLNNPFIRTLDYSAAISASTGYMSGNKFTAPCDGVLEYCPWFGSSGAYHVNDNISGGYYGTSQGYGQDSAAMFILSKGDTFYCDAAYPNTVAGLTNSRFIPFKGAY